MNKDDKIQIYNNSTAPFIISNDRIIQPHKFIVVEAELAKKLLASYPEQLVDARLKDSATVNSMSDELSKKDQEIFELKKQIEALSKNTKET
jgi:hypothetical protein